MNRIQNACARLRQEGYRVTPQRLAIIDFVFRSTAHPTVKEIYEALSERFPTMSLMTVYQTVHVLTTLGELTIASTQTEHTHYDGTGMEPHAHLVCQRCGAVVDADPCSIPSEYRCLQPAEGPGITQQGAWEVHHWRVEGVGLCPNCQGSNDSEHRKEEVQGRQG